MLRYHSKFEKRPTRKFRNNEWERDRGAAVRQVIPSCNFLRSLSLRFLCIQQITYHDKAPCHIVNENSVAKINEWMEDFAIDYRYYRPTVLIEAPAFSEDLWEFTKIGDLEFNFLCKNTRCKVSHTDPVTGEIHDKPMEALKK